MTRKRFIIIAGLLLAAGVVVYLATGSVGQRLFRKGAPAAVPVQSGPTSGHEGHTGGPQPEAQTGKGPEDTEAPVVEIPTDRQQLMGVKVYQATVRPLQKNIRTVGRIEYDERRISTVNMKFEGWIEKLYIDYTGRYVKKGEPLAEIYSPELIATQQELINALKWAKNTLPSSPPDKSGDEGGKLGRMLLRDAETVVEAARQRLMLWDISEAQIKKIEETGRPVRTLTLYSPAGGYVVQKTALQGMKAMPGERLFDIADLSSVWVVSDVYEYDLAFVKEGQTAAISLSYFPGKEFAAKVDYVYPALSAETKTAKVRFSLPNPGGRLKPQMFTNVEIKVNLGSRLVVPDEAVIDTGLRQVVYVDRGEGNFEPREVLTGLRADGMTEVTRGLKAGESVASSANFLIDSEAQLKGIKPLPSKK